MSITENDILNKVNIVADTYLSVTGKSKEACMGISLTDYLLLREQAINEIQRGIVNSEPVSMTNIPTQNHTQKPRNQKKIEDDTKPESDMKKKEVHEVKIDATKRGNEEVITNELASKFEKLKDW